MPDNDTSSDHHESNTQRRLREALDNLPPSWESNRPRRSQRETLSQRLEALRNRLDRLVALEEELGSEQRGVDYKRAERNALIFALQQLAPLAEAAGPGQAQAAPRRPDPAYVNAIFEDTARHMADGYSRIDKRKPGVLMHRNGDDVAPLEVSLTLWFYVVGLAGLKPDGS